MDTKKLLTKKGIMFLMIFSALVFIGEQYNFSKLFGTDNQFFTFFQFFGPVAGYFLGPFVGVLSVLIAEVASKLINPDTVWNWVTLLRLTPMLFAAWYFGTNSAKIRDFLLKDKIALLVPILAIAAFIAHPVGRQVWYFSLFWTIPVILKITSEKYSRYAVNGLLTVMLIVVLATNPNLLAIGSVVFAGALYNLLPQITSKSLGATFTAHAVGGAIWNYIVPMTPSAWISLIPIVIFERLVFAGGITVSFLGLNTLLDRLSSKTKSEYVNVDKKHVLFRHAA